MAGKGVVRILECVPQMRVCVRMFVRPFSLIVCPGNDSQDREEWLSIQTCMLTLQTYSSSTHIPPPFACHFGFEVPLIFPCFGVAYVPKLHAVFQPVNEFRQTSGSGEQKHITFRGRR